MENADKKIGRPKKYSGGLRRVTLRLHPYEIDYISTFPGATFTDKFHHFFLANNIEITASAGEDLAEKYEILLRGYMKDMHPEVEEDIEILRKKAKKFTAAIERMEELMRIIDHIKVDLDDVQNQVGPLVEGNLAQFVEIQRKEKKEREKRNAARLQNEIQQRIL